jgi:hypothetical protein
MSSACSLRVMGRMGVFSVGLIFHQVVGYRLACCSHLKAMMASSCNQVKNTVLEMVCSQLLLIPVRFMDLCMVLWITRHMREGAIPASHFSAQSDGALGEACWAADDHHGWKMILLAARRFLPCLIDQISFFSCFSKYYFFVIW